MIFVSVGTHEAPFDRLLEAVDDVELDEPIVIQHGPSRLRPSRARCTEFMSFDVLVEHIRAAEVVVTHAGVGSVMVSLANGKRPIVVPRLRRFGEHVDDHQLSLARRLAGAGLVTLVEDAAELGDALAAAEPPASELESGRWLGEDLRTYLAAQIRTTPAAQPTP